MNLSKIFRLWMSQFYENAKAEKTADLYVSSHNRVNLHHVLSYNEIEYESIFTSPDVPNNPALTWFACYITKNRKHCGLQIF